MYPNFSETISISLWERQKYFYWPCSHPAWSQRFFNALVFPDVISHVFFNFPFLDQLSFQANCGMVDNILQWVGLGGDADVAVEDVGDPEEDLGGTEELPTGDDALAGDDLQSDPVDDQGGAPEHAKPAVDEL